MSEDPTRATRGGGPAHGSVGPDDPHADPATDPRMRAVDPDTGHGDPPTGPVRTTPGDAGIERTRTGGLWVGLILSAVVLVVLLVFILQNLDPVRIQFLGLVGQLPTGVALLLAAVAGLLLVAIPGGLRILQLRRLARRAGQRH